jgi:hypothetical protein
MDRDHKVQRSSQGCRLDRAWLINSAAVVGYLMLLGEFAYDKADATRQQQTCRCCHLLVYFSDQLSGANADPPLTVQHLPFRSPDLSRQRLGFASV